MAMLGTPGSANDPYDKNVSTPDHTSKRETAASKRCCSPRAVAKTFIIAGALLVVVAVLYGTVLPAVIDKKIKTGVVVCNLADTSEDYFDPYGDCEDCTPYYYTLHMFNVTNAEAHLATGVKLTLQESGAYVYRRRQIKVDVSFENNRVSYRQYTYHTFEPSLSCTGCKDTDVYTGIDVGYLSVLASAGGEVGFLTGLVNGTFGKGRNPFQLATIVRNNGTKMMRWVNGLNSLDPAAMKNVGSSVMNFLLLGPDAIASLDLSGFAYNGLFVRRTIKQWALGYPSLLAGLGLGSTYVGDCTTGPNVLKQCQTCKGDACLAIWAECKQCQLAASVVAANNATCDVVEQLMAASYGATEGKAFAASTCRLCDGLGLCAAPLPGIVEDSGMDWSKTPPPTASLSKYVQRTGCDDLNAIGEYELYNGETSVALWTKLDSRRNPTLAELAAFSKSGNCANPTANLTCSPVKGADGQSLAPGGASISGFADSVAQATAQMYLSQGKQEIAVYNLNETVEYEGIALHRFAPAKDLLTATPANAPKGTGFPVDGVQPVGFTTGFLAYVSYPLFLWGNESLLDAITVKLNDGITTATHASMYDTNSGALKQAFYDKYMTFIDVEAGTGKTMRARKRLQASYALSKSALNVSLTMTDVLWPKLPAEVIVPAYWGEERATVGQKQIDAYTAIKTLLSTMLPGLIAGGVVGLMLAAFGCARHGRASVSYKEVRDSVI